MSRLVIRPDREAKWKKSEAGADQPSPNRSKPARPGSFDRFVAGRVRLQWEPVRARRRLTGHDEYESVRSRERDETSTPMLETSAVADQRKTEEMMGGGEESEANAESGTGADARCGKADERGRNGKPESKEATATKDEETDTEVGSTASGRDEPKHALRPTEGREASMHSGERQRVTGNGGPVEPMRGKDSVGDREREEPSTPIRETSVVADRWK